MSSRDEEIRAHLDLEIHQNIAGGMSPEEARYEAHRRFGSVALTKDKSRVIWGFSSVETVLSDLRYGLRMIVKWPGFSSVVILILALGIGVTTAIFSAVNAVLLQPLPYPQSDRLMMVIATSGKQDWRKQPVTVTGPCFDEWKQHNQVFEQIGGFINAATPTNISGGARARPGSCGSGYA